LQIISFNAFKYSIEYKVLSIELKNKYITKKMKEKKRKMKNQEIQGAQRIVPFTFYCLFFPVGTMHRAPT